MSIIYLRHPVHGAKIASLEMEANYDEQHGWERYTPGEEAVNELRKRSRPRKEPEHADLGG